MIPGGGGCAMIPGGGGCALIAGGGGCALIAGGGGCAMIAGGGGCALIAGGMVFFFSVCTLDCIIKSDLLFDVLDLCFHKPRNANFCLQRHHLCDDFGVFRFTLVRYIFCRCFKIPAFVRRVVIQHINWLLTRMEASLAKMRIAVKNSSFAELVLKPTALHILICAFINLHVLPPVSSTPPATAAGINNDLRPPARPAHTSAPECSSTDFRRHTPFRFASCLITASQKL